MQIHCQYSELVDSKSLKPHPKNRNKHPDDQIQRLAKILEYQGWRYPIKVSKRSGYITSGHGRLLAAHKLGLKEVPVSFQDYDSDEQEYADVQADNAIASWSELDLSAINLDIADLGPDFDIDLLGLKDFTIDVADKGKCDEDEVPETVTSTTKLRDLYLLGNHRLLCGCSTSVLEVEKLMNGEKADMVFTDPPYGVGYKYNSHDDNVTKERHFQFLKDLIGLSISLSDRFILTPGCNNLDAISIEPKPTHVGCWTKTNAMSPGRLTHFWTWEPILFYGKWPKKRANDVFNFPVGSQSDTGDHPCPKPIALWQDIVENFSEPKESILDLFGGSGSTLIACEKTNRKCFMAEIDPHYCSVIIERWCKYSGKEAYLVNADGSQTAWTEVKTQNRN